MATGGYCQIQDSLSCGVCFERYDGSTHLPKMLPCQHTFCNSCIGNLTDDSFLVDAFECPICRAQVHCDEIRINLVVIDIVEAVVAKDKAKLFCLKHPTKDCQLVCTDCLQFLCGVCSIKGEHTGHTVDDIDDAKDPMKKRLTTAVETKIANLVKANSTKVDKMKKELAQQEEDINTQLNTVIYMITKALNEWKQTQLQKAQQAIDKEIETSKTQQESLMEKLQPSDLKSILSACKEVESKESKVEAISIDVTLPKINSDELQNKLTSMFEMIQTLIKASPSSPASSSPEDIDESHISWDFIVHLCSSAVPQKDPSKRAYIPPCVKRVANLYNCNRNRQFLRVVLGKWEGEDILICRTDDFVFQYVCSESSAPAIDGVWDPHMSQEVELLEKESNVLHDPEYATVVENAVKTWVRVLVGMRDGEHEPWWEVFE